jgi:hypothetical protein
VLMESRAVELVSFSAKGGVRGDRGASLRVQ